MPSLTSEQAERLSQLELRNDILFVGLLIWGAALLFWLLYNFAVSYTHLDVYKRQAPY